MERPRRGDGEGGVQLDSERPFSTENPPKSQRRSTWRTSLRAAEHYLIRSIAAYRRGDDSEFRLYLGATNRLAAEGLASLGPRQGAEAKRVQAVFDSDPALRTVFRECLIAWAASHAK